MPPEWIAIFCLAAFVAFTIASTFGIGGPLILLPILMLKFSPAESIAMIVPVMFLNNLSRIGMFFKHLQFRPVIWMLASAIPIAAATSFFTGMAPPAIIKGFIVLMIAYVIISKYLFDFQAKTNLRGLFFWGFPIGMISGLSGTAGPPMAIAMRGYGLVLEKFVATIAVVQAFLQLVRLPGYISSELLNAGNWKLAVLMSIASFPSIFLSRLILRRLKAKSFDLAINILLGIIGLVMFASILSPLFN